jgi:N-hydroxyarylamine O-acetyltransferase
MFDLNAYLTRIHYEGSTAPTLDTLRAIHRAHLLTVPFENLDIAWCREIAIDEDAFVRKVVERRRGGFCYELNGAFAALLRALGFQVTLLSARVAREQGGEGPEFDHLCLQVDLEEPWLADVGFGESFLEPLRLQTKIEQSDPAGVFRFIARRKRLTLEKTGPDEVWKRQFSLGLKPRSLDEFAGMCHYHQTSPESYFTQKRVCSRATDDGRITLADMKLIVTRNGQRNETTLASEQEWREAVKEHFGIVGA